MFQKYRADEIKVCVGPFKIFNMGFIPYFNIWGCHKTINESSILGEIMMAACLNTMEKVPNPIFLNHSTHGVICELLWNRKQIYKFINGSSNQVLPPDTNHNVNNTRYNILGVNCATIPDSHIFNPWLMKISVNDCAIWHIDEFASDLFFLRL